MGPQPTGADLGVRSATETTVIDGVENACRQTESTISSGRFVLDSARYFRDNGIEKPRGEAPERQSGRTVDEACRPRRHEVFGRPVPEPTVPGMNDPYQEGVDEGENDYLRGIGEFRIYALREKRHIKNNELRVGKLQKNSFREKPKRIDGKARRRCFFLLTQCVRRRHQGGGGCPAFPTQVEHEEDADDFDNVVGGMRRCKKCSQTRRGKPGDNERTEGDAQNAGGGAGNAQADAVRERHQYAGARRQDGRNGNREKEKKERGIQHDGSAGENAQLHAIVVAFIDPL